jgi:hypothetical protein
MEWAKKLNDVEGWMGECMCVCALCIPVFSHKKLIIVHDPQKYEYKHVL